MPIDLQKAYEDERKRRLAGTASQINDTTNNANRFSLFERQHAEKEARIKAHQKAQARDLWVRQHPGQAVPEHLRREPGEQS